MDRGGSAGSVDDSEWQELKERLRVTMTRDAHVKVGVMQSKGGGASAGAGLTMVDLATIHEFGAPAAGIPERSFIRRTFAEKHEALAAMTKRLAAAVVTKKMPVDRALGLLGAWGAAEVKRTITSGPGVPPPLSPVTIARKGSTRPLVDTGRLVGAITWQVIA